MTMAMPKPSPFDTELSSYWQLANAWTHQRALRCKGVASVVRQPNGDSGFCLFVMARDIDIAKEAIRNLPVYKLR